MERNYQVVNETSYDARTIPEVIRILEACRQDRTRIRVHYGDVVTGKDWIDVTGKVGRSMGPIKVPLLIHNCRSLGGGALLDHCIVRIVTSKGKRELYRHPLYHQESK